MNFHLSDEQEMLKSTFERLFSIESSPARIRAVEATGFDPKLWNQLVETGAIGMRVAEKHGGLDANLLDVAIVAEQAGRHLASVPLIEAIVACRLLSRSSHPIALTTLADVLNGNTIVSLALRDNASDAAQLVYAGSVANAVVGFHRGELVLVTRNAPTPKQPNLGSASIGYWTMATSPEDGARYVLSTGVDARNAFIAGVEEWKLLTAAAMGGLAHKAIEIAAKYASEREQFGRPIGSFQAIAHPLANAVTEVEGGQLLVWYAIWSIAKNKPDAGAIISMAYAWIVEATQKAIAASLHTHGGYGLTYEYDIQLYFRRGRQWALQLGDPHDQLVAAARQLWDGQPVALPDVGECSIDFSLGDKAEEFRSICKEFLQKTLTDELKSHAHFSWDGHNFEFQRALAKAGLLYPTWPKKYGGQDRSPYEAIALLEELAAIGWTLHAILTTRIVGETVMHFGGEELKLEVLNRIASGEAVTSLGYTEPSSGSDVAAAQTRAVRDGEHWIINGQKMFTSGANLTQYVFLLTRTDPAAPKHKGLTLFLVPLDLPGIEIHTIQTIADERTTTTFYADVRVADRYRIGGINEGWSVMTYALEMEHGGGGATNYVHELEILIQSAIDWSRNTQRLSGTVYDDARVKGRLAHAMTEAKVSLVLSLRGLWRGIEKQADTGQGPMSALFNAEAFIRISTELLDLCAPDSMLSFGAQGAINSGVIELGYRHSAATSIYGGSSEILRSIIAQTALLLPRSRS